MAELEWMIGKWEWKGDWFPNDPSERSPVHFFMECEWLFEKTIIQCDFVRAASPEKLYQRQIYHYDSIDENYVVAYYAGRGIPSQPGIGSLIKHGDTWVEQGLQITPRRKSYAQTVKIPDGDSFRIEQYASREGAPVKKVQEATLRRVD